MSNNSDMEFVFLKKPSEFRQFKHPDQENQELEGENEFPLQKDQENQGLEAKIDFQDQEKQEINLEIQEKEKCNAKSEKLIVSLGELSATNDDDEEEINDGFKTPTSSDCKIPVIEKCPPAPRKPKINNRILSTKRKASSEIMDQPVARRRIQLDLCQEVDSLFPKSIISDLYNKIRKAR